MMCLFSTLPFSAPRFPRPDIFREATEPKRWKYHQDVDAQFIHMGHPLFDVAHFLHRYRHAFVPGAFHQRRIRSEKT